MRIMIDGYNLLKNILKKKRVTPQERQAFLNQIAAYARNKGHMITIIFDGGDYTVPVQELNRGIAVIYTGFSLSADLFIIRSSEQDAGIVIVTSDGHVRTAVARQGSDVVPVHIFMRSLQQTLNKPVTYQQQTIKMHQGNYDELFDSFMENISSNIQPKKEDRILPDAEEHIISKNKKKRTTIKKL